MPHPPQPDTLPMGVLAVSNAPLPGQEWRASGNIGIGSLGCPLGDVIEVALFGPDLQPFGGNANVGVMQAVSGGADHSIWSSVTNGSDEAWITEERAYVGGADGIDAPFYAELYALYDHDQISMWPEGDPSAPTNRGVNGLLSGTLSQTSPLAGQQARCSGNFNTMDGTGPVGSTITFEIRYARRGTNGAVVDPWQCPVAASDVTVDIMEDISGGDDQRIWSGISHGATQTYASYTNLYVDNPSPNVLGDFFVLAYRTT